MTIGTSINGVSLNMEGIKEFCRKNHIKRLSLFGSIINGGFNNDSDIDVLVDFDEGHIPGLLALTTMEMELSEFMSNCKVDLRTKDDLSHYFREEVVNGSEVVYSEA